ncbi:MAG: glycoside hydrolase family 3 protein [Candidatus Eremiobacteraeota bacterium]|nr:glycoside hydrolase family 3 protein [Candidatus Eremiobacteraeota bacterium]
MTRISELARGVISVGISAASVDQVSARFAGYILFPPAGAGIREVRELTDSLRARDDLPPVVAIDQEGGAVMRLRSDVEPMPSMMAVGAADEVDLAQRAGEQIAFDLRRAGCTLDFAPVLDLAIDAQNTVIGTRSFGSDPAQVTRLGSAFAQGLAAGGILPCYKHFPGHGATAVDSHKALPVINVDESTIRERDLVPFAAVARQAPAIMSAHAIVTAFDARQPATLSRRIALEILRGELGFRGVFVTDCLEMGAVAERAAPVAVEALAAGADLLLFSHHVEFAVEAAAEIERAIAERRLPLERLEEAHSRVSALRRAGTQPLPLDDFPPHPGVGREIARRAVAIVRGVPHADPVASIAVSFGGSQPGLQREAPALKELLLPLEPTLAQTRDLVETLEESGRRPIVLTRRAHRYPLQASAVAQILRGYPDALVVSLLEPYDVAIFLTARHLLATCGDDAASIGGLADVIFGGIMPTGRLPVSP